MFSQQIEQWQIFFATVAGVSATLMGLIFLSLSLKLEVLKQMKDKRIRQVAWQTFSNFFFLIMFALVFLVPEQTPIGLSLPILIICVVATGITISQAVRARSIGAATSQILSDSLPSLIAYVGLIVIIVLVLKDIVQSLVWLLPVVIILLATAVRNAWTMLVSVTER
jgi:hypothetical protein